MVQACNTKLDGMVHLCAHERESCIHHTRRAHLVHVQKHRTCMYDKQKIAVCIHSLIMIQVLRYSRIYTHKDAEPREI